MIAKSFLDFANRNLNDYRLLIAQLRRGEISVGTAQTRREPLDSNAQSIFDLYPIMLEVRLLQMEWCELIEQRRGAGAIFLRGHSNGENKP